MTRRMLKRWLMVLLLIALSSLPACTDDPASGPDDSPCDGDESDGDTPDGDEADGDEPDGDAVKLPRLRAQGMDIVDEDGNVVVLKGVNLGGYLYHETWITLVDYPIHTRVYALAKEQGLLDEVAEVLREVGPWRLAGMLELTDEKGAVIGKDRWLDGFEAALRERLGDDSAEAFMEALEPYRSDVYDDSDLPLMRKLEERFGVQGRDELLDTFLGAWIQEHDIQWIAEQGFNLVRVPIGYRTLTTGSHMVPPTELVWNETAFGHIENLLDWCEKWGIYAILDIQECPGGQNDYSGDSLLYENQLYQDLTVQLWEELSERYHHRDVVAAYSLLAEPMSAPSTQARDQMYDRLVKAIRDKGDDHLLVIHDGFKSVTSFPDPASYGWDNVIYSTHIFEWGVKSLREYTNIMGFYELFFRNSQEKQGVPYFIGSFSGIWDDSWAHEAVSFSLDWYDRYKWSWSLWTYKRLDDPIALELWDDRSGWGLRGRVEPSFERPDIFNDDFETLRRKFASYADLEVEVNHELLERLQQDIFRDQD